MWAFFQELQNLDWTSFLNILEECAHQIRVSRNDPLMAYVKANYSTTGKSCVSETLYPIG